MAQTKPQDYHAQFSLTETDNTFLINARRDDDAPRDRHAWQRDDLLGECLDAWRFNPLARRIVELTSQYVVGGGITLTCSHGASADFLHAFWDEPLNRMDVRVIEMCDELTRSGNLFVLLSTDAAGMSYLRIVPGSNIESIQSASNDIEQSLSFTSRTEDGQGQPIIYPAYATTHDQAQADGQFPLVMLHYAINRPAGAQWGESDLAPLLCWLARYSAWLEDRVRLNRFRNAFLYVVKARFTNEAARRKRQLELAANPPSPGSLLVTDETEEWSVISPRLEALDAATDGLALKKMIAAGAGVPLHFLAEPESATRTTAEAAGGPTYRRFEQRQRFFTWMLSDLLRVVLRRRNLVDRTVDANAIISVSGADISARDNLALSMAGINAGSVGEKLVDMGLVERAEMLRLVYRFLGETEDTAATLARGSGVDRRMEKQAEQSASNKPLVSKIKVKIDPETGEIKPGSGMMN